MDSMENNKIAAAVLTAGIAFWGLGLLADNTVHPKRLAKSAIEVKGSEAPAAGAAVASAEPAIAPIGPLLIKATPADGEALTKKVCIACHNFQAGGGNKVGPALYGVVGRTQASAPGYQYSTALGGHHAKWTYAELNKWLLKPAAYAPGTKMAYAGISNDQTRADVISYLRTLSTSPVPLPTPAEAAAEAATANKVAATPAGAPAAAAEPPLPVLLAKANPADGLALTKKICIACHNFNEGGANKVGPALYGIVGRTQASAAGYTYSTALSAHHGAWSYDELNKWLTKPSAYAPGTKMAYAGISNPQTRADVIDYLRTLSANPLPLPKAEPASFQAPSSAGGKQPGVSGSKVKDPATNPLPAPVSGKVTPSPAVPNTSAPEAPKKPTSDGAQQPGAAGSHVTGQAVTPPPAPEAAKVMPAAAMPKSAVPDSPKAPAVDAAKQPDAMSSDVKGSAASPAPVPGDAKMAPTTAAPSSGSPAPSQEPSKVPAEAPPQKPN